MAEDIPQLYLVTPPSFDLDSFIPQLASILDAQAVACLRLELASRDEDAILRAGDALRELSHARDIPLVITDHVLMVERLGLDGVHLSDPGTGIRKLRDSLGADAIIGAHCGNLRHDGMAAGEAGADYIAFGPVGETLLGDGAHAERELFEWWSELIEVPVVADGFLTPALVENLAPVTDFFAIGPEIWGTDDPLAQLRALIAPLC
ncbi:Thiamine-phosphate synthase [Roseibaca ekhonensis]|jgi:thiamine-phosphate pyrophosphorylase|uniref:Thiamine-phosphate synthase n=1 Tax=Roseinatronobacter ekhonensis TaxID=254356 RepID=A0A3B0M2C2_9RHOB|nr:thiamine phosphate synthase [Roseibaca ekhonensis]SUZ30321.1 Thiamine-phosphate synthase [Roseibaca ekhonensis]